MNRFLTGKFLFWGIITVMLLPALFSCSKKATTAPEITAAKTCRFSDFIHFPGGKYIVGKIIDPRWNTKPEPVLFWEQNFGEPFTDVNHNGIYDPDIDTFKMSMDPSINQDLDRNSRYTGPNEPWTPGIPFDDINGDGICQQWPNGFQGYKYIPGLPFGDWNGNGVWDSILDFKYDMVYCSTIVYPSGTEIYSFMEANGIAFSWVSDSGRTYYMMWGDKYAPSYYPYFDYKFTLYSKGLILDDIYQPGYLGRVMTLLDSGVITESKDISVNAVIVGTSAIYSFRRSILIDTMLSIGSNVYDSLLLIRFNDSHITYPQEAGYDTYEEMEFYFSRHAGLLAIKHKKSVTDSLITYYLDTRPDKAPIPAIR
jgi:hypothetical protein